MKLLWLQSTQTGRTGGIRMKEEARNYFETRCGIMIVLSTLHSFKTADLESIDIMGLAISLFQSLLKSISYVVILVAGSHLADVFVLPRTEAGEVTARDCKVTYVQRVNFSVDRPGLIADVPEEGDVIEAGQIVVQLRDEVPRANLAMAAEKAGNEAAIAVERKTAEQARLEYTAALEAVRLSGPGLPAYPPTHISRLKLNLEAMELKVQVAENEKRLNELARDVAQAELQTYRIVSSVGGVVVQVFKRVGEGVQQGEGIVELVNVDRLRVEGFVSVEDALRVKPGMDVRIHFEIPEGTEASLAREVQGKLGFVDVSVHTLSDRVRVWTDLENSTGKLREGLSASMQIIIPSVP